MVISWVHRHAGYELQRATAKWNWIKNKAALVTKQTTGNWPLGFCSWLSTGSQESHDGGKGSRGISQSRVRTCHAAAVPAEPQWVAWGRARSELLGPSPNHRWDPEGPPQPGRDGFCLLCRAVARGAPDLFSISLLLPFGISGLGKYEMFKQPFLQWEVNEKVPKRFEHGVFRFQIPPRRASASLPGAQKDPGEIGLLLWLGLSGAMKQGDGNVVFCLSLSPILHLYTTFPSCTGCVSGFRMYFISCCSAHSPARHLLTIFLASWPSSPCGCLVLIILSRSGKRCDDFQPGHRQVLVPRTWSAPLQGLGRAKLLSIRQAQ